VCEQGKCAALLAGTEARLHTRQSEPTRGARHTLAHKRAPHVSNLCPSPSTCMVRWTSTNHPLTNLGTPIL